MLHKLPNNNLISSGLILLAPTVNILHARVTKKRWVIVGGMML